LNVFAWHNSKSTISLIDNGGNSKWQYATPNGIYYQNNFIEFK